MLATNQTSIDVAVEHPATAPAGGWASLELKACLQSNSTDCPIKDQSCTIENKPNVTATNCTLTTLLPAKQYIVEVRGLPLQQGRQTPGCLMPP